MSIKNVFTKMGLVEEDAPVTPTKKTTQAPTPNAAQFTAPSFYQPQAPTPTVDPAISEMLSQSLQASKLSGFDYLKFTSSVEKMKTTGIPEEGRYKAAFSAAQELGVDKAELLKSGEHYLSVLKEDETDFNSDCSQYEKKEIQARETKLSEIEGTITNLTKQLAQLQQDHAALQAELQDEQQRLEQRKSAFQSTLQNFRSNIESNIQKINQYLS